MCSSPTRCRNSSPPLSRRYGPPRPPSTTTAFQRDDFVRQPRAERLARLRTELASRGLDGFIVPRADEHQGEYVPPRGQRLAWLTGFTGSAGLAIVLARPRSAVCRWAVHIAGGRPDRYGLVRDPSPGRGTTGAMARHGAQERRGSRLRSLAAHAARGGAVSRRCGKGRCRAPRCPRQPARPGLARPTGSADRTCRAASRAILRRERRVEAHPAGAWLAAGGGRGCRADDAGIDRLAPQHPRRRRAAHPAAIVICDPAAGRLRQRLHRPAQARPRARTPSRQRRHRDAARATGTGTRCSLRPKAAGCRPIRRPPPPGCSTDWQKRERRSIAPPTRVSCRRHAKMPPKSRAPGRRITETARR